jgi:phenylacetate-CoA ligase
LVGRTVNLNWEDLPVLTKVFTKPLLERLSKGYKASNSYINKTSGSSGTPFIFATNTVMR